jgi:DNA-binding NarL/FixJ family response regulator
VLIVDDHPSMRRGLAQTINDQPHFEVTGEAAGFAEALDLVEAAPPDLVIVDISLDEGNGLELTKAIKARWSHVKVLVLSMHEDALFAERALRAGALGYVNKSEEVETIVAALDRVLSGQIYLSGTMTDRLLSQVVHVSDDRDRSPLEKLSDRELQVFEMIGRGHSTKQIAARLELSRKTVETYREHIKAKLKLKNSVELSRDAAQWVLQQRGRMPPPAGW